MERERVRERERERDGERDSLKKEESENKWKKIVIHCYRGRLINRLI